MQLVCVPGEPVLPAGDVTQPMPLQPSGVLVAPVVLLVASVALPASLVASLLVTTGAAWLSFGAGLIVAGVCAAVVTVLFLVDVGGDE